MNATLTTDTSADFISETYELLQEELSLTSLNVSELYSTFPKNDILGGILAKIDSVRKQYNLTQENSEQLTALAHATYAAVFAAAIREFPDIEDAVLTGFDDAEQRAVAMAIYNYLYLQRRNVLKDYLTGTIFANRTLLSEQYKNADQKKDIAYQSIRTEFPFTNSDYYPLILNLRSIATDYLTSDTVSITDALGYTEVSENELDMLTEVFSQIGRGVMQRIGESLVASEHFRDFLADLKLDLLRVLQSAK